MTTTQEKVNMNERTRLQKRLKALEEAEREIQVEIAEINVRIQELEQGIINRQVYRALDELFMDLDECFNRMLRITEKRYELRVLIIR